MLLCAFLFWLVWLDLTSRHFTHFLCHFTSWFMLLCFFSAFHFALLYVSSLSLPYPTSPLRILPNIPRRAPLHRISLELFEAWCSSQAVNYVLVCLFQRGFNKVSVVVMLLFKVLSYCDCFGTFSGIVCVMLGLSERFSAMFVLVCMILCGFDE